MNGHKLQIPDSSEIEAGWRQEIGKTIMPLPLSYLKSGKNRFRFESGRGNWSATNIFDDFEVGQVVLVLSSM